MDERRSSRRDARTSCRVALLTIGADRENTRLETDGADGTAGTAMLGGGGAGILAALPMPLGSLTELLRPPALPGPRGMPLTPASCARIGAGAARQFTNANAKNHDLPNIDHAFRISNDETGLPFLLRMNTWVPRRFIIPDCRGCMSGQFRERKMNSLSLIHI